MIFVTDLFGAQHERRHAKAFTDGNPEELETLTRRLGFAGSEYVQPVLRGAEVVDGGYYPLTMRQRDALIRAGAVPVSGITSDLPLAGMLAVAGACARKAG